MSSYIDEPYQDEYQNPEAIALENEIDIEEDVIKDDPDLVFTALLDYLKSDSFSDDDEQIENLGALIDKALNADFINRHRHDVALINAAIRWQAKKNVGEL